MSKDVCIPKRDEFVGAGIVRPSNGCHSCRRQVFLVKCTITVIVCNIKFIKSIPGEKDMVSVPKFK